MSRACWLVVLSILVGCKGKEGDKAPSAPAPIATKTTPADAATSDAAAAPAGVLAFDTDAADGATGPGPSPLALVFGGKYPRLPAISADDKELATYDWLGSGPMIPAPMQLGISAFPTGEAVATLRILAMEEALDAIHKGEGKGWDTPAIRKRLPTRAPAVLARLRGFRSLERIELANNSNGVPQMTKIGAISLWPMSDDSQVLTVELRDAKNAVLQSARIAPYQHGTKPGADGPMPCDYRPGLDGAFRDPARPMMIYLQIGFHYGEECDPPRYRWIAWSTDPAAASPVAAIRDVVTRQFDMVGVNGTDRDDILVADADVIGVDQVTTRASLKMLGVVDHAMDLGGHEDKDVDVAISRDGKSAWASEIAMLSILEKDTPGRDAPWRASDVLTKTPNGWRIAALAWTEPRPNDVVNREAKAGKLAAAKLEGPADAGLSTAFAALTTAGVDAPASARADLVAIGSGPGERTVGGASFARAWNAAWKGKVAIVSSVARALPSGTTGWVAATIELAKPGAKLPFTVFCVFDKDAAGAWSLVHVQLAVGPPTP